MQREPHPHFRRRKPKPEPYPSRIFRVAVVDVLVYFVSVAGPIMTIPQVYDIFVYKNAAGVSPVSWGAYTLFSFVWIAYGIIHKERVLIINSSLWLVFNALIFVGALLY